VPLYAGTVLPLQLADMPSAAALVVWMKLVATSWMRRIKVIAAFLFYGGFACHGIAIQISTATSACKSPSTNYIRGITSYNAGKYNAALHLFQSVETENCTPKDVLLYEARTYLQLQHPQLAEKVTRIYLKIYPQSGDAHFLMGYIYLRENHPRRSLGEYTAGARFLKPDASALAAVALDYGILNDFVDADHWLTEATTLQPNNSLYWYYLGRAKYNENHFQEAIKAFQKSLALDPKSSRAWSNLGLANEGLGDDVQAKRDFETAIQTQANKNSASAQPYLNLGELLLNQSKVSQAMAPLQQAELYAPENPKVHEELGRAYEQSSQLKKAQEELSKAVELAPKVPSLHFELGRILKKEGLSSAAKEQFDMCAAINRSQSTDSMETPNPDGPE
jgi:tetratricopeptide (TPR) repeat protein